MTCQSTATHPTGVIGKAAERQRLQIPRRRTAASKNSWRGSAPSAAPPLRGVRRWAEALSVLQAEAAPPAKWRRYFGSWGRRLPPTHSQTLLFTWPEVQSIVFVPTDEQKGHCLLAISTLRAVREEGTREWMLQAGGNRARACWSLELVAAILRHHANDSRRRGSSSASSSGGGGSFYSHSSRAVGLSLPLFMDMSRIACEVGRLKPSTESMETLISVLDMLADGRRPGWVETVLPAPPHLPIAALRRFRDAVKRAHSDFVEWQRWRAVVLLVRAPAPLDETMWHRHVVPFIKPKELLLQNLEDVAREKLALK
eukprot:CAMPEP_0178422916 /NCGR_PEP_ID=MMETSP0689_2-20121128/27422_1 /TAXON_ID=160604 /ORGANISM="Amphidinium massartii, Strain CS-259" /LENGTH=312 /DNA_ID=CAMNT_0020044499 /DNA_START=127 /DNA_END=1063 /DNA_ORIENTATION=-